MHERVEKSNKFVQERLTQQITDVDPYQSIKPDYQFLQAKYDSFSFVLLHYFSCFLSKIRSNKKVKQRRRKSHLTNNTGHKRIASPAPVNAPVWG